MKYNESMRSELLKSILSLKYIYEEQMMINSDVKSEIDRNKIEHPEGKNILNCKGVDDTVRLMTEMNRDLCILLRSVQRINHALLYCDNLTFEQIRDMLDIEVANHLATRSGYLEKWGHISKKRMALCDLLVVLNSPEADDTGL